jgi:hypothetical protein
MATSNFHRPNTDKIYTAFMEDNPEHWEVDDFMECLQEFAASQTQFTFEELDGHTRYPVEGQYIFSLSKSKVWGNVMKNFVELTVTLNVTCHSGYYQGICFDFETEILLEPYAYNFDLEGWETYDEADLVEDMFQGLENRGLCKIFMPHIKKWVDNTYYDIKEDVEKILGQFCPTHLQRVASFSNGETMYRKVN